MNGSSRQVILLIGQSNMDGRGLVADLAPTWRTPIEEVPLWYRHPQVEPCGWVPTAPGYSVAPWAERVVPGATFGPELPLAAGLRQRHPDRAWALIKVAQGGTSLESDWRPGAGPCYDLCLEAVEQAMAALPSPGGRLAGVVWHQGEADAGLPPGAYRVLLAEFINRLRQDLASPLLPVVVAEVCDDGSRAVVRAEQRAAVAAIPRSTLVECTGTATSDHGTHLDAASQVEMGGRYLDALGRLWRER